jgi:hypothetical protein
MTYEEKLREAAEEYYHYHPEARKQTTFKYALFHCQEILKIIKDEDWMINDREKLMKQWKENNS